MEYPLKKETHLSMSQSERNIEEKCRETFILHHRLQLPSILSISTLVPIPFHALPQGKEQHSSLIQCQSRIQIGICTDRQKSRLNLQVIDGISLELICSSSSHNRRYIR